MRARVHPALWWLLGVAVVATTLYLMRSKLAAGALALLQRFEGRERRAYKDSAGLWTIGVGHLIKADEMSKYVGTPVTLDGKPRGGIEITDDEIDRLAAQDYAIAAAAVKRQVTVPLTEDQTHALVSFVFNLGGGALGSSTLLRKLNAGDYRGAAAEFLKWDKATDPATGAKVPVRGLTLRRAAEKTLFETGIA